MNEQMNKGMKRRRGRKERINKERQSLRLQRVKELDALDLLWSDALLILDI